MILLGLVACGSESQPAPPSNARTCIRPSTQGPGMVA